MNKTKANPPTAQGLTREVQALREQLAHTEDQLREAQELIQAIRSGEVDALVVEGP